LLQMFPKFSLKQQCKGKGYKTTYLNQKRLKYYTMQTNFTNKINFFPETISSISLQDN
jgi:hypothetical protein